MKALLDTSVFLKLAANPEALPAALTKAVDEAESLSLSAASAWEIAIKASIKKLKLPAPSSEYVRSRMAHLRITSLPITSDHATAVESLPWHHRDPFDRLLIAQALLDGLTILTTDSVFAKYGVRLVAAKARKRRR